MDIAVAAPQLTRTPANRTLLHKVKAALGSSKASESKAFFNAVTAAITPVTGHAPTDMMKEYDRLVNEGEYTDALDTAEQIVESAGYSIDFPGLSDDGEANESHLRDLKAQIDRIMPMLEMSQPIIYNALAKMDEALTAGDFDAAMVEARKLFGFAEEPTDALDEIAEAAAGSDDEELELEEGDIMVAERAGGEEDPTDDDSEEVGGDDEDWDEDDEDGDDEDDEEAYESEDDEFEDELSEEDEDVELEDTDEASMLPRDSSARASAAANVKKIRQVHTNNGKVRNQAARAYAKHRVGESIDADAAFDDYTDAIAEAKAGTVRLPYEFTGGRTGVAFVVGRGGVVVECDSEEFAEAVAKNGGKVDEASILIKTNSRTGTDQRAKAVKAIRSARSILNPAMTGGGQKQVNRVGRAQATLSANKRYLRNKDAYSPLKEDDADGSDEASILYKLNPSTSANYHARMKAASAVAASRQSGKGNAAARQAGKAAGGTTYARESKVEESHTDRPLAAKGLTSYRSKNPFGWTMIGAKDHEDAHREALRSYNKARREDLQVWDGKKYVPAHSKKTADESEEGLDESHVRIESADDAKGLKRGDTFYPGSLKKNGGYEKTAGDLARHTYTHPTSGHTITSRPTGLGEQHKVIKTSGGVKESEEGLDEAYLYGVFAPPLPGRTHARFGLTRNAKVAIKHAKLHGGTVRRLKDSPGGPSSYDSPTFHVLSAHHWPPKKNEDVELEEGMAGDEWFAAAKRKAEAKGSGFVVSLTNTPVQTRYVVMDKAAAYAIEASGKGAILYRAGANTSNPLGESEEDVEDLDEAMTPEKAAGILKAIGISHGTDFFELPSHKVSELLQHAKKHGYKRPTNANGSKARYFHAMLRRKAEKYKPVGESEELEEGRHSRGLQSARFENHMVATEIARESSKRKKLIDGRWQARLHVNGRTHVGYGSHEDGAVTALGHTLAAAYPLRKNESTDSLSTAKIRIAVEEVDEFLTAATAAGVSSDTPTDVNEDKSLTVEIPAELVDAVKARYDGGEWLDEGVKYVVRKSDSEPDQANDHLSKDGKWVPKEKAHHFPSADHADAAAEKHKAGNYGVFPLSTPRRKK